MNPDVENLIQEYFIEMSILEAILENFREKYKYLDSVKFNSLDDLVKFSGFLNVELGGVRLIQFLGLSECRCHCERDCFLWVFTDIILDNSRVMTMGQVLEFIERTDMICEHEQVAGFLVGDDIIHILVKRGLNEVNGGAGEEAAITQT